MARASSQLASSSSSMPSLATPIILSSFLVLVAYSSPSPILRQARRRQMSSCAEETGLVAMDCLVVCCCCPCLVLQVTVFLLVRLPRKVVVKTKRIILRRWHRRRPAPAEVAPAGCPASAGFKLVDLVGDGFEAGAFGTGGEGWADDDGADGWRRRCFAVKDDDDGVWEALVEQEGLFWFGSFWGRPELDQDAPAAGGEARMDDGFRLPVALERVCA